MNYFIQNITTKFPAILFISFLITFGVFGQETSDTPAPTPTPSELERKLEEEKRIKTLQKEIAEAEQAIRNSKPQPKTTPLEGKTEMTDVKIESDMVTYRAVSSSLEKIAEVIKQKAPDAEVIILYSAQDMANVDAYRVSKKDFDTQINALTDRYNEIKSSYCRMMGCGETVGEYNWRNVITETFTKTDAVSRFITKGRNPASEKFFENTPKAVSNSPSFNLGSALLSFVNPITGTLGAAADILALLRTDMSISGQAVTVKEDALVSEMSRIFRDQSMSIYYPQKYLPLPENGGNLQKGVIKEISELNVAKKEAEKEVFKHQFAIDAAIGKLTSEKASYQRKIESLDKYIAELVTARAAAKTLKEKKEFQVAIRDIEVLKAPYEGQIKQLDEKLIILNIGKFHIDKFRETNSEVRSFFTTMTTSSDGKMSKMLSFLKAEKLIDIQNSAKNGKKYYWLEMEAVSAGGNNRTRKNLILYFTGAKADHSGGVIIAWKLYNSDGSIKYSGIDQQYEGYISPKKIRVNQRENSANKQ